MKETLINKMNVKINLNWIVLEGHFGKSWMTEIEGLGTNYHVWIDRETGKTISANLKMERTYHISVEDAKEYCQSHFNEIISKLINSNVPTAN